jgi:hypothetical protein
MITSAKRIALIVTAHKPRIWKLCKNVQQPIFHGVLRVISEQQEWQEQVIGKEYFM